MHGPLERHGAGHIDTDLPYQSLGVRQAARQHPAPSAKPSRSVRLRRGRGPCRRSAGARHELVATERLAGSGYGETVLIAAPLRNGASIGFIINRPTGVKLGALFLEHAPSRKMRATSLQNR
jgi:hypothetical protein